MKLPAKCQSWKKLFWAYSLDPSDSFFLYLCLLAFIFPLSVSDYLLYFMFFILYWTKVASRVFPCNSAGKESACNAGDLGLIPVLGRFPGEGNGTPLYGSCLENPIDRGACQATVHGVTRVRHDFMTKPPPKLLYNVVLVFKCTTKCFSDIYTHIFFFKFFCHLDYYRILSRIFPVTYSRFLLVILLHFLFLKFY